MALVIPEGFGQVNVIFSHISVAREAQVTFGIQLDETENAVTLVNHVFQAVQQSMLGRMDSNATLQRVEGRLRFTGSSEPLSVVSTATPAVGGNAGEYPAPLIACLIRKRTSLGGRRGRGRLYWPWVLAEANITEGGVIDGAAVLAVQTEADDLIALLAAGSPLTVNAPMFLLHDNERITKSVSGNVTTFTKTTVSVPAPSQVNELLVDNIIASQRRRQRS